MNGLSNKRINPTSACGGCRLSAPRYAEAMAYTPQNVFEPPKDIAHPTPDPHQDEAAALGARRSPASAFVGIAIALAGLAVLYVGRPLLLVAPCLAGAAIVVSAFAWRAASRQRRPSGVAVAGLVIGIVTALIVLALYR